MGPFQKQTPSSQIQRWTVTNNSLCTNHSFKTSYSLTHQIINEVSTCKSTNLPRPVEMSGCGSKHFSLDRCRYINEIGRDT